MALFGLVTFGLSIGVAVLLWWVVGLDPILAWLVAITVVTLAAFGYDKAIAGTRSTRVPEKVLLYLTLAGGTVGALVAMPLFHHKTIKGTFRRRFWLVVVLQVVALVVIYLLLNPQILQG